MYMSEMAAPVSEISNHFLNDLKRLFFIQEYLQS
jgi:hypothetical protein